jgi:phage tail sheath protein FI
VVQLAVGLQFDVGQSHQEILNPNGVNCIRQLRGMGIRVWGARTLSQSDPEWRYINVRRLFHMIEQSIQRSTMWAVFEPNDQRLWAKLRRDVGNFLMLLYSQGMLFGATAAQAFFVKCDETNNPKHVRDAGQVIIDVGVAPVKPAEFIVFRIRQWSPEDEQV